MQTQAAGLPLLHVAQPSRLPPQSLEDFATLRVIAKGALSTVWQATPKQASQHDLPGGGWSWGGGQAPRFFLLQFPYVTLGACHCNRLPAPCPQEPAVAIKAYHKAALGRSALRRLLLEQRILQTVHHHNIIRGTAPQGGHARQEGGRERQCASCPRTTAPTAGFGSFEEDGHLFLCMEHAWRAQRAAMVGLLEQAQPGETAAW